MGCLDAYFTYETGWVIIWKHGYQAPIPMIANTMIKTKGTAYYKNSNGQIEVWDAIDVVNPPVENGATFLTTNFQSTMGQSRGICDSTDPCKTDEDCKGKSSNVDAGGIRTGNCTEQGYCQVYAWCPVEADVGGRNTTNYLVGVEDFTIFIRTSISFPQAKKSTDSGSSLVNGTNFFTLDHLIRKTSNKFEAVRQLGAVIALSFDWSCNLDRDMKHCVPTFTSARLDDPKSKFSTGFNFRYASHYSVINETSSVEMRNLFKVYGIRLVVLVSGVGGKFDFKNLMTNLGSGLAMLSIAAVVADFLLLHILPKKDLYRKVKLKELPTYIDETEDEAPPINQQGDENRPLLKA